MIIVGIDPGWKGAIATRNLKDKYEVYPMPEDEFEIWEFFNELKTRATIEDYGIVAYIEQVHAIPLWGSKASWDFSSNVHAVRMALIGNKIRIITVKPKVWQKTIGLHYPKKSTGMQKKKCGNVKAKELHPELKFKLLEADSLLILRYGCVLENVRFI